MSITRYHRWQGVTTSEYVLIALLVLSVCLIALTMLGNNLQNTFSNMLPKKQTVALSSPKTEASGPEEAVNTDSAPEPPLPDANQLYSNMPPKQLLETLGANGASNVLASEIEANAKALLESGKVNQTQYEVLMRMANKGHQIAEVQGILEQAFKNSTSRTSEEFYHEIVTYQGKEMQVWELQLNLGSLSEGWPKGFVDNPMTYHYAIKGTYTEDMKALYQEALATGVLSNPSSKALVTDLAGDILRITEGVMSLDPVSYPDVAATGLDSYLKSHQNSGGICATGGYSDSGTACN